MRVWWRHLIMYSAGLVKTFNVQWGFGEDRCLIIYSEGLVKTFNNVQWGFVEDSSVAFLQLCVIFFFRDYRIPVDVLRKRELKWLDMLENWEKWMSKRFKKVRSTKWQITFYHYSWKIKILFKINCFIQ